MLFQADNPIARPNREQEKVLDVLQKTIERDAVTAKVSPDGIRGITLQQVPDAHRGFVRTIKKCFGVSIQFIRATTRF